MNIMAIRHETEPVSCFLQVKTKPLDEMGASLNSGAEDSR